MHKANQWIALASMASLGGCFFVYDYAPKAENGGAGGGGAGSVSGSSGTITSGGLAGGNGGMGGGVGESSSSSSGGVCTVTVCGVGSPNSACMPQKNTPCPPSEWAHRYGTDAYQQAAHAVAMGSDGAVIVGGSYTIDALQLDMDTSLVQTSAQSGFLIKFAANGDALAATNFVETDVVGVAVDSANNISTITSDKNNSVLRHWFDFEATPGSSDWDRTFANMTARAVAVDSDRNIYVVGEANAQATFQKTDMGIGAPIAAGLFVISYGADGVFRWARGFQPADLDPAKDPVRGSAITINQGVWVTGYFRTSLTPDTGDPALMGNGDQNMFLMRLVQADGKIIPEDSRVYSGKPAGGNVEPAAVSVDARYLYVAGSIRGQTPFSLELEPMEQAAFVLRTDVQKVEPDTHRVFRGKLTGQPAYGSRMAGVLAATGRVYVAGSYASGIKIDPFLAEVPAPNGINGASNTPFIAQLDATSLESLSFTPFPGGGEPISNGDLYFAGQNIQVEFQLALAGAWTKVLDFRQGNMMRPDLLLEQPMPVDKSTTDMFVAKLKGQL